jgi:FAS-associated factor 2
MSYSSTSTVESLQPLLGDDVGTINTTAAGTTSYPPAPRRRSSSSSSSRSGSRSGSRAVANTGAGGIGGAVYNLLSLPFSLLASLLRLVLQVLRLPVPRLLLPGRMGAPNFYRPLQPQDRDPKTAAERFVRMLEEETGALRPSSQTSGASTSRPEPYAYGSYTSNTVGGLTHRNGAAGSSSSDGPKSLPDFTLAAYDSFLTTLASTSHPRIGLVVLTSSEHDDHAAFVHDTLTDPSLLALLEGKIPNPHASFVNDHDGHGHDEAATSGSDVAGEKILVWGGDVRSRDAHAASLKLGATTFPFVAFLALQPARRSTSSSTSSSAASKSVLTVLSRHQGPSTPSSGPSPGPTSPSALIKHITATLLPRVTPYLSQLRATTAALAHERRLRADQDAAFAAAAQKDVKRIEAKIAAERDAVVNAAKWAKEDEEARAATAIATEGRVRRATEREAWRRYMRRAIVPAEARVNSGRGATRVVLRLPQSEMYGHGAGERVVRVFPPGTSVTALYAFAAASLLPEGVRGVEASTSRSRSRSPSPNPPVSPGDAELPASAGGMTGEEGVAHAIATGLASVDAGANAKVANEAEDATEMWWGFTLAFAFPRRKLAWAAGKRLEEMEGFRGGAQLVVELVDQAPVAGSGSGAKSPERRSLEKAKGKGKGKEGDELLKVGSGSDDGYHTESD